MTLSTIYNKVIQKDIYQQLYEQMIYDKDTNKKVGRYTVRSSCRFCDKDLVPFFKFDGLYPLAGGFLHRSDEFEELYPLSLSHCNDCLIFQCNQVIDKDVLFRKGYFYYSSMIPYLVKHFTEYSDFLKTEYYDETNVKTILEMGCNDGVLLRHLDNIGFNVLGIDPSDTVKSLIQDGITVYNDYFNERSASEIVKENGKVDIFLTSNSFAHIDDMESVLNGIKIVLKNEGVAIDGYFVWTLTDNFEWAYGFTARFGLVRVDFDTQLRTIKDSGYWFRNFLTGTGDR
jgi:SAM-dependent methyltransferase